MAKKLPAGEGNILEQGQKYEGYVVWFNNLVASAGGDDRRRRGPARRSTSRRSRRRQIIKRRRDLRPRRPVAVDHAGGPGAARASRQDKGAFLLNWPYVYAAARADAETGRGDQEGLRQHGLRAAARRVNKGEPSKVSIGGANLGVPNTGKNPELATEAALCMTSEKWQAQEAINEGLPPVMNKVYDDPEVRKVYPFADLLREQLKDVGGAPGHPVLLRRDAGDPGLPAPAGHDRPAEVDRHAQETGSNTVADGGMY